MWLGAEEMEENSLRERIQVIARARRRPARGARHAAAAAAPLCACAGAGSARCRRSGADRRRACTGACRPVACGRAARRLDVRHPAPRLDRRAARAWAPWKSVGRRRCGRGGCGRRARRAARLHRGSGRRGTPPGGATPGGGAGAGGRTFVQGGGAHHGGTDRNADEPPGARPRRVAGDARRARRSRRMTFSDENLSAYADGELDEATRAALEAAMAADPVLARRVARHRALRARVQDAFAPVLTEPVPERLLAAARGPGSAERADNVIAFQARPRPRWSWPQWGAMAACLIAGLLLGPLLLRPSAAPTPLATSGGRVLASGVLARALSQQLSSAQPVSAPVEIGVSF